MKSRIHVRAWRNRPLTDSQTKANTKKSRVRARIERVFGAQENAPGGRLIRTISAVRAKAKIGLQNLTYNIRSLVTLTNWPPREGRRRPKHPDGVPGGPIWGCGEGRSGPIIDHSWRSPRKSILFEGPLSQMRPSEPTKIQPHDDDECAGDERRVAGESASANEHLGRRKTTTGLPRRIFNVGTY